MIGARFLVKMLGIGPANVGCPVSTVFSAASADQES
jgi:hypothetical protein